MKKPKKPKIWMSCLVGIVFVLIFIGKSFIRLIIPGSAGNILDFILTILLLGILCGYIFHIVRLFKWFAKALEELDS